MVNDYRDLPRLVDVRGQVPRNGSYRTRSWSTITDIAEHHSGTAGGDAISFGRYHVGTLGWPGPGYHFVIIRDGTIQWCNSVNRISFNVGNSNSRVIGICIVGNGSFTAAQERSRYDLKRALMNTNGLDLKVSRNLGHNEYPGHSWNQCPGINMNTVREALRNGHPVGQINYTPTAEYDRTLRLRDPFMRGEDVKTLQRDLKDNGHDPGSVDGVFGPNTERSLRNFQDDFGLLVDGIAGPQTFAKLETLRHATKDEQADHGFPRTLRLSDPMLRGSDVERLQIKLRDFGFNVGTPDGVFGPRTRDGVRAFQREKGLSVDGIAGPQTFSALISPSRIIIVADRVNVRSSASFDSSAVVDQVRKGEVFTVSQRVNVSGSNTDLYRLKSGLYITTHRNFVKPV